MIQYYQELLNRCIDKQEDQQLLKRMQTTLVKMKNNLKELKGGEKIWGINK